MLRSISSSREVDSSSPQQTKFILCDQSRNPRAQNTWLASDRYARNLNRTSTDNFIYYICRENNARNDIRSAQAENLKHKLQRQQRFLQIQPTWKCHFDPTNTSRIPQQFHHVARCAANVACGATYEPSKQSLIISIITMNNTRKCCKWWFFVG